MIRKILSLFMLCLFINANAQTPEIYSWHINLTGQTGYNGLQSNVQAVNYTTTDVYVSCTCIPGYDIGPWAGNPNTPSNQNFVFKITRTPVENTGTKTATPLGHIGVWSNGVSIFNARDAFSYNNQGVWNQDAIPNEGSSFDDCLGHPAPNGEYHHHVNPACLYDWTDDQNHSPIIGYAFDGFPIYGAYGFANTNGTGGIVRMESSYQLRNITARTHYADGTDVTDGPVVNTTYPLGKYIEDYEYINGLGHLDEYNGRFCVTPDYPAGTYAYFVTLDSNLDPQFPYTVGNYYYGTVQSGNTGPTSGHNTIPGSAVSYVPTGITELENNFASLYPNPAKDFFKIEFSNLNENTTIEIYSIEGKLIESRTANEQTIYIDASNFENGIYLVNIISTSGIQFSHKVIKQ